MDQGEQSERNREHIRNLSRFRPLGPEGIITSEARFRRSETDEDITAILKINESMFGAKLPLAERLRLHRQWLEHNPEVSHVLEYQNKVVGYLTFLPLTMETINKLLRSEITFWKIDPAEITPYEPGIPTNIFIQTLAVDPAFSEDKEKFKRFGAWLLKGLMNMFLEWGKNGIEINQVFARSDTEYGQYFSIGLGFDEVPAPEGVHKRVFVLDTATSKQPFIDAYRTALDEYHTDSAMKLAE